MKIGFDTAKTERFLKGKLVPARSLLYRQLWCCPKMHSSQNDELYSFRSKADTNYTKTEAFSASREICASFHVHPRITPEPLDTSPHYKKRKNFTFSFSAPIIWAAVYSKVGSSSMNGDREVYQISAQELLIQPRTSQSKFSSGFLQNAHFRNFGASVLGCIDEFCLKSSHFGELSPSSTR